MNELKELVEGIRKLEKSLGSNKKIYDLEKPIEKWAKRSLVAIKDIKAGEKLSDKNIWSKRPGTEFHLSFLKLLVKLQEKTLKIIL